MDNTMLSALRVKIFADGAEKITIFEMHRDPLIAGFTTNPTLMRKAGIRDYKSFAVDVLSVVKEKPISFEVFSDDFREMEIQAQEIGSWGENVYIKIPITNTKGQSSAPLIARLAARGLRLNVTAIMTVEQVEAVTPALAGSPASFVSVFAGRIADTGRNPLPIMREALKIIEPAKHLKLIWASPRELLNVIEANDIGCHIITVTSDLLKKLSLLGKSLDSYSLETVKMFYNDALAAGYKLTEE